MVTVVEFLQLAVKFLQPTFAALSKRLSSEQVGRVTPFCSCDRLSISRLAKSLRKGILVTVALDCYSTVLYFADCRIYWTMLSGLALIWEVTIDLEVDPPVEEAGRKMDE